MRILLALLLLASCAAPKRADPPIPVVAPDSDGRAPSTPKNRTVYERK